ncbi:Asparagine synthetase [glutamine-hydrolyzing] [hydrothermal vent metagenome]|uniref:Asparagine synthetase [glutamine-hydrolyzing] n=1 Tax=hydrothermal vent metagenome TaxID=652676 RepID=A0A3B1DMV5_9ZZZZ
MCGILGLVTKENGRQPLSEQQIIAMRDDMTHRGPDDAGLYLRKNVAFAHRRLAIRDISGGKQPWLSDDESVLLVYNGELYNDQELRKQLEQEGYRFRSRCDTEVVLAAYQKWGDDCVMHFRGMFAFGIYDFQKDRLLLARDRFGVKPLFVTNVEGTLVFSSTIRSLLQHPQVKRQPNFSAISHYLTTLRLTLHRETLYENIWQLLPGERLRWHNGNVQIDRYWEYPEFSPNVPSYTEAVNQLEEELREAVACRMVSDVPVGMFMSGGVDSNTIACFAKDSADNSMQGRCARSNEESTDARHAELTAQHVGFEFETVDVSESQYLATWESMIDGYATPLATPSDVMIYRLSHEMKKSVGVVLGGEGADELLCGYGVQHWAGHDYDRYQQLTSGNWQGSATSAHLFKNSLIRNYGTDHFSSEVDHYFALNSLMPTAAKESLFQPGIWKKTERDQKMFDVYQAAFDQQSAETTSAKQTQLLHQMNLESLLGRLDSSTMLASLEARVPFTDHQLVESIFKLPESYKIGIASEEQAPYLTSADLQQRGSLHSKKLLRSVSDRLMPRHLSRRKKASFPTPVARWMSQSWQSWTRDKLLHSPFGHRLFQPKTLRDLADNTTQSGMWLWPLLNICMWGDRQFV